MTTTVQRRGLWASLLVVLTLILSACTGATLNTELNLESESKGTRLMNLTIENSSNNSDSVKGGNAAIDASIKKHKPEGVEFSGITTEGDELRGTFTISFESVEDYRSKVESLLNASGSDIDPEILISNTQDGLVTGTTISENFTSNDLLRWVGQGLVADGVIEKSNENRVIQSGQEPIVRFAGEELEVDSYSSRLSVSEVEDNGFSAVIVKTTVNDDASLEANVQLGKSSALNSVENNAINSYLDGATPEGAEVTDIDAQNYNSVRYGKNVKFTAANAEEFSSKLQKLLGNEENKLEINSRTSSDDATTLITTYSGTLNCVAICSPTGNSPRFEVETPENWHSTYADGTEAPSSDIRTTTHFSNSFERKLPLQAAEALVQLNGGTGAEATFTYTMNTDDVNLAGEGFKQALAPAEDQGTFEESEADGKTTYTVTIEGKDQEEFSEKLSSYIPGSKLEVRRPGGIGLNPNYQVKLDMPLVDHKLANLTGAYTYELRLPAFNSINEARTNTSLNAEGKSVILQQDSYNASEAYATKNVEVTAQGPSTFTLVVWGVLLGLLLLALLAVLLMRKKLAEKFTASRQKKEAGVAGQQPAAYAAPAQPAQAAPADPTVPLNPQVAPAQTQQTPPPPPAPGQTPPPPPPPASH